MTRTFALALLASTIAPCIVHANIPVSDQAILEKKSETASKKVKIKKLIDDQGKARDGVRCAVTTGKKAKVTDPRSDPNSSKGENSIKKFDTGSARPESGKGSVARIGSDTMAWDTVSSILANQDATGQSVSANQQSYASLGNSIGSSQTVMQAFDENSGIRSQNALSWNTAIQTATALTKALNLINLQNNSDKSRASSSIGFVPQSSNQGGSSLCPSNTTGQGTQASPCRSAVCSTTAYGLTPDSGCVTQRYTDSYGNIIYYLAVQQQLMSQPELNAAVNQYEAR